MTANTVNAVVNAYGAGNAANTIDYSDPNSVANAFVGSAGFGAAAIEFLGKEVNPTLGFGISGASLANNVSIAIKDMTQNGGFNTSRIKPSTMVAIAGDISGIAASAITAAGMATTATGIGAAPGGALIGLGLALNSLSLTLSIASTAQGNVEAMLDAQKSYKINRQAALSYML